MIANLASDFLQLVKVASPSGEEFDVQTVVKAKLTKLGLQTWIDSQREDNKSNTGNLLAKLTGKNASKVLLMVAHLDTVQKPGQVVAPIFDGTNFKSDGKTILGADNKAGVAILVSIARTLSTWSERPTVYFLFTTREEQGKMGSSLIKLPAEIDWIINLDGSQKVGTFDYAGLGQTVFEMDIKGKAAHAAKSPELGVNAILVASKIVASVKQGKFKNGDTVNIGYINAGGSTNIVPDLATIRGEVRSFKQINLSRRLDKIKMMAGKISSLYGAKIKWNIESSASVPPFNAPRSKKFEKLLQLSCDKLHLQAVFSKMSATSDASFLSTFGKPVICVNHGGQNPHALNESISLKEMQNTLNLLLEFSNEVCNHG